MNQAYPSLVLDEWRATRDALHGYARVLGNIRRAIAPRQKHWWHISLRPAAAGLTTTPMNGGRGAFDLTLDLAAATLWIRTSWGAVERLQLAGWSVSSFNAAVQEALKGLGIEVGENHGSFSSETPLAYDPGAARRYWEALSRIHLVFDRFKAGLREETSPVQLWPHHFDLALMWFSGRKVEGADPADEEQTDEQMNFGFSTGDQGIPEPYFYATAYPLREGFRKARLPEHAAWNDAGWQGGRLLYKVLLEVDRPDAALLTFLQTLQAEGSRLMSAAPAGG